MAVPGLLELITGEPDPGSREGTGANGIPPHLEASEPPEARGLARDGVRLMVATGVTAA